MGRKRKGQGKQVPVEPNVGQPEHAADHTYENELTLGQLVFNLYVLEAPQVSDPLRFLCFLVACLYICTTTLGKPIG